MNKIGFQNFRRFRNFPSLELGPITFLVGRNNSGKSTLVKAYMLVINYLTSRDMLSFSIGENNLEEVNIVTFGRALHQPKQEEFIRFLITIEEFDIEITITGNQDDTIGYIKDFIIYDSLNQIEYYYNWKSLNVKKKTSTTSTEKETNEILRKIDREIDKHELMIDELGGKKGSREYLELIDFLNQLKAKRDDLIREIANRQKQKRSEFSLNVEMDYASDFEDLFDNFIRSAVAKYQIGFKANQNNEPELPNFASLRAFYEEQPTFESSIERFLEVKSNIKYIYLSASSSKQSALLSIRDRKNELAQSIHKLYTGLGSQEAFIKEWMMKLEVGEDYSITPHAGEAYEVKIKTQDDWIHLSDLGLGSIQAMQLIFRIANILDGNMYNNVFDDSEVIKTVFIEEPELNLHPALQSKLADLFFETYDKYKVRFIIETHSEYLIRKTQLLVKEKELEIKPNENPFCVIYFDGDKQWKMNYREDGVFIENFGTGFFDVSSQHAISLMKRKV